MNKIMHVLGPCGTNGHEAAQRALVDLFPTEKDEFCINFCDTNASVLEEVIAHNHFGILPVENSTTGTVPEAVKDLWRLHDPDSPATVVGDVELSINNDQANNVTRFYVLGPKKMVQRNVVRLKPVTVCIVGIAGNYGRWLKCFFKSQGCIVIGFDRDENQGAERIKLAQVVAFAVLEKAHEVIQKWAPYGNKEQLWLDVTGLKVKPIEAMLSSEAEVLGLHPMCAPTGDTLRGQTIVAVPTRINKWGLWVHNLLFALEAKVKVSSADDHDKAVAVVQNMPHEAIIAMAALLRSKRVDVTDSLTYTSPFYRLVISLIGRLLKQKPELYAEMQFGNPHTLSVLEELEQQITALKRIVQKGESGRAEFVQELTLSRDHFGEQNIAASDAVFNELLSFMADSSSENRIVIRFKKDRCGLLVQILTAFAHANINLTNIRPKPIPGGGFSFLICFDKRRHSPEIHALVETLKTLEDFESVE